MATDDDLTLLRVSWHGHDPALYVRLPSGSTRLEGRWDGSHLVPVLPGRLPTQVPPGAAIEVVGEDDPEYETARAWVARRDL